MGRHHYIASFPGICILFSYWLKETFSDSKRGTCDYTPESRLAKLKLSNESCFLVHSWATRRKKSAVSDYAGFMRHVALWSFGAGRALAARETLWNIEYRRRMSEQAFRDLSHKDRLAQISKK